MQLSYYPQEWLKLSPDDRRLLAAKFGLRPTSNTAVVDNLVTSDGYTFADLQGMTIAHLIDYLGTDLPWYKEAELNNLTSLALNKLHGKPKKESRELEESPEEGTGPEAPVDTPAKRRPGRPKKTV